MDVAGCARTYQDMPGCVRICKDALGHPRMKTIQIMVTNQKIKTEILQMKSKKPYDALVIIGPSAVGKSTLMSCLPENFMQMRITSTRKARKIDKGEKELVSEEEFSNMSRRGDFAATEKHAGNSYGVKKKDIEAAMGAGMIPVMDFKGEAFKQIKLRSAISQPIELKFFIGLDHL